ncbi:MAG: lmo0937 family membrane protein [Myxococcales bacterium]|nr:lmo0937 family membrane protein [Myxococcales bacterium]
MDRREAPVTNLLLALATILVIGWEVGYSMNLHCGGLIHGLLVLAAVAVLVRVVQEQRAPP